MRLALRHVALLGYMIFCFQDVSDIAMYFCKMVQKVPQTRCNPFLFLRLRFLVLSHREPTERCRVVFCDCISQINVVYCNCAEYAQSVAVPWLQGKALHTYLIWQLLIIWWRCFSRCYGCASYGLIMFIP